MECSAPRLGENFPEDLVLHGLAPSRRSSSRTRSSRRRTSELPTTAASNPRLPLLPRSTAGATGKEDWAPRRYAGQPTTPTRPARNFLDDPKLRFRRPMPTPRHARDHFDALTVLRQKPILKDILEPLCLCRVTGRNGGSPWSARKCFGQRAALYYKLKFRYRWNVLAFSISRGVYSLYQSPGLSQYRTQ